MRQYTTLSAADIGVLAAYFVLVILIGLFAMWRSNRDTASGYFLAGRSMWFLPIGASLFVSNIGTEHFIGLAGSGAASGISVGAWEFNALLLLQLLGWIFVPVYIACGTYTMPEYLSLRFGGQRLRVYFALLSLVLYVFTKCSGDLYTGALFIQQSLNWDLYVSIVVLVLLTALLTITGGLTAVIYTDTLQATLMVGGALYLMVAGFQEVGGFQGLLERYPQAVPLNVSAIVVNSTCHWPDTQAFRMLRDVDDDYMPWLGFLLGQTPGSIWYWCTDQVIVQRALAAKSVSHAQGATLLAGFIKILPLFIMVIPGMISRVLYPNEVACTNPDYCMEVCQSKAGCSSIAYPRLVLGLMPDGAKGLMMAVMIAALMSDLDSIFNSASTLFTMDVWRKFRKRASSTELMVVGRLFILVMVGVSIAWVPVIKETNRGQVFIYIQEVTNYFAPPFAAVFLMAVLVPVVNEKGAFWSLMVALVAGVTRLVLAFVYKGEGYCGEGEREVPAILADFHYMYFALFLTAITAVVALVVSFLTGRPEPKYLYKTTYWTRHDTAPPSAELELKEGVNGSPDQSEAADVTSIAISTISGSKGNDEERRFHFVDPELLKESEDQNQKTNSCKHQFLKVVCGLHDTTSKDQEEEHRMKHHLETLASLQQSTAEKAVLAVGLAVILGIGVAMYVFWSVYDFREAPFYPEGAAFVLPGDLRNLSQQASTM
ncbi:sodium/myo-inositol cotransporter-like [Babylonia areolata]|uniref:sodium/myo-inositol cotransporter-like n=1 Tax=Babylonia areolata TaxID=304850 RepID=UPI003FD2FDC5